MPNNPYRANWTGDGPLRKFIVPQRKIDSDNREITFTISTNGIDRDGDIIDQAGWELGNYIKNPVVLWAHNSSQPPIARAKSIRLSSGSLVSTAVFATKEEFEFADTIFQLYKGGFLNAVSVGFLPKELELIEDGPDGAVGFRFIRQELMEFSAVPVPSNPEALIVARGLGIDINPMKAWIEKLLDHRDGGSLTELLDKTYIALNGQLHPVMKDALMKRNLQSLQPKDDTLDSTPDGEGEGEAEEEVVETVIVQSGPTDNLDASEPHTHDIEVGSAQTEPYDDDGHVHAITYDAEGIANIEEAEGHGHDAPASANIRAEEVEGNGTEGETEEEAEGTILSIEIPDPIGSSAIMEMTDWPAPGMNLKVGVLTSEYRGFPPAEAQALKEDWPVIWDMGEGDLFDKLLTGDASAVRAREKWAARNVDGYDLSVVVSQIRHLVRSSRGIEYVRLLLSHTKEQLMKIPDPVVVPLAPAPVVEVNPADVISQVMQRGVIPAIEAAIRSQTGRVS